MIGYLYMYDCMVPLVNVLPLSCQHLSQIKMSVILECLIIHTYYDHLLLILLMQWHSVYIIFEIYSEKLISRHK